MAGNRIYQPSRGMPQDTVAIAGKVVCSTTAPSVKPSAGQCSFTPSRTGAGVYVLTFDDTFPYILDVNASVVSAAGATQYDVRVGAIVDGTSLTNTVTLLITNASTNAAADPADGTIMTVSITVTTHSE